jgi:hypothetical protein
VRARHPQPPILKKPYHVEDVLQIAKALVSLQARAEHDANSGTLESPGE